MAKVSESLAGAGGFAGASFSFCEGIERLFSKKPISLIDLIFKGGYPEIWTGPFDIDDFFFQLHQHLYSKRH